MVALTGIERACRRCWLVLDGASLVVSVLAVTREGRKGRYGPRRGHPVVTRLHQDRVKTVIAAGAIRGIEIEKGGAEHLCTRWNEME